jgi:hypothetical protein
MIIGILIVGILILSHPHAPRATGSTQNIAFLVSPHDGNKKFG